MAKNIDRYVKYAKTQKRQERLRRWGLDVEEKNNGMQVPHSAAYHDYFEGYAETRVPSKSGIGYTVERVYVGDYYLLTGGGKEKLLRCVMYAVLYLLAAAALIFGAAQPGGTNTVWYVVIPTFGGVISMILLLTGIASYISAPLKMTIGEHKSGSRQIVRWSLVGLVACCAAAVGGLIYMLINGGEDAGSSVNTCICCFMSGLILFVMNHCERHAGYEKLANDTIMNADAVMIE